MAGPAFFAGGMSIAKNYDWTVAFILQDIDEAPIDLTGSVLRLMIRKNDTDHEAIVEVTSDTIFPEEGGIEITDAPSGAFTVIITREQLARLSEGNYEADLVRETPDGKQQRLWDASPVTVVEGVTR